MWLTRTSGESDESVEITGERFLIGRDPTCNLVLDDEKVSRQHSVVEVESDGRTLIRDLDSSNGTFVDGSRIGSPVELNGGEKIRIGDTTLMASGGRPAAATVVASSLPPPQAAEPQAAERQVGRSTVQRIVAAAIAGEERKIRREVIIAGGLGILGVVAAAAVGALFATGTIGGGSHGPSVASLERATVLIQYQQVTTGDR